MKAEFEHLRSLARVIDTAEATLDAAYTALRASAFALLTSGTWTLSEISEASGLSEGELLDLLTVDANTKALEQMLAGQGPDQEGPGPHGALG
ncbi:hypothetical protein AB0284_17905 [Pseudarthrobacter phenanthrenivorans]|uniref:hypothetical protein n=1 Tax=Pseudarthrobacter phenanthrenivorans TaxID=361575 RepID=UPI00344D8C09